MTLEQQLKALWTETTTNSVDTMRKIFGTCQCGDGAATERCVLVVNGQASEDIYRVCCVCVRRKLPNGDGYYRA